LPPVIDAYYCRPNQRVSGWQQFLYVSEFTLRKNKIAVVDNFLPRSAKSDSSDLTLIVIN